MNNGCEAVGGMRTEGKRKYSEKTLPIATFIHYEFCMTRLEIEPGLVLSRKVEGSIPDEVTGFFN
jgi:hypothetical protein